MTAVLPLLFVMGGLRIGLTGVRQTLFHIRCAWQRVGAACGARWRNGFALVLPANRAAALRRSATARGANPDVAVAGAVASALVTLAGAVVALAVAPEALPVVLVAAFGGLAIPHLASAAAQRRWQLRANDELPLFLEILAAAIAATTSPAQAMGVAADSAPPSLAPLVCRARLRVALGTPAIAALRIEGSVVGCPTLARVAARIERAVAIGIPTAERIHAEARELREETQARRTERAGRVVPLATLISAMVIAPACVMILGFLVVNATIRGVSGLV